MLAKLDGFGLTHLKTYQKCMKNLKILKHVLFHQIGGGRPEEITEYKEFLNDNNFQIQGVMAELKYLPKWI